MAEEVANYAFLPFLRQGVGSQIADADLLGQADGTVPERPTLQVDLVLRDMSVDGAATNETVVSKAVQVVGPGDVTGINPRVLVRTEPKPDVANFEANSLAYIEFYEEDFLWRYTPASPDSAVQQGRRLRPWLALVVLRDDEFKLTPNPNGLAFIHVEPDRFDAAFHHQADTWAMAHVHLNELLEHTAGEALATEVGAELRQNPDVGLSRLLCPRKLMKNTGYTAFLIPAFETGRLTGLGLPTAGVAAQMPSWKKGAMPHSNQRPYEYPVYYQWSFRTGTHGDFESLAAILKPIIMEKSSGTMAMDIQSPGFGLDGEAESKTLGFEGALRPANFESPPWPVLPNDIAFQQKLKTILNLSADLVSEDETVSNQARVVLTGQNPFFTGNVSQDPIVVPPVYGVWHVMARQVGLDTNPPWFNELNLDPRLRGTAGLGTRVVQKHQESLVNRAWKQIDQVNEANKRIREAEMAKQISNAIFKKHLVRASLDKAVMMTGTVHGLLLQDGEGKTVEENFRESRIPLAAKLPAFRKITRPAARATARHNVQNQVIQKFNADIPLTTAELKKSAEGSLAVEAVNSALDLAVASYATDKKGQSKDLLIVVLEEVKGGLAFTGNVADLAGTKNKLKQALGPKTDPADIKTGTDTLINNILSVTRTQDQTQLTVLIQPAVYEEFFKKDGHEAKVYGNIILQKGGTETKKDTDLAVGPLTTQQQVQSFKERFSGFGQAKAALPQPALLGTLSSLGQMKTFLQVKLSPEVTLANRLLRTIRIWQDGQLVPLPELKPVMAYPEFHEPVYRYLLELSKDYLIPNIDKLPKNSITLLETNQRFIEAFMVGLNHEMARELLWREYPTDQRGSYFRQFWDVRDNVFEPERKNKLDIQEVHRWTGHLGDHNPRGKAATLVLVVRGELLIKYPDTMIYAQQARYDPADARRPRLLPDADAGISPANTKMPLFRAEIEPDITLVGFDLTDVQAKGERITVAGTNPAGKNPGWFFVFKERPGHIRFGLDDSYDEQGNRVMPTGNPATWNDLTWEHLVSQFADLDTYHLTFNKALATTTPAPYSWNSNAADLAAILYQNPVIFARHAGEMLPSSLT